MNRMILIWDGEHFMKRYSRAKNKKTLVNDQESVRFLLASVSDDMFVRRYGRCGLYIWVQ